MSDDDRGACLTQTPGGTPGTADSDFVSACFEAACHEAGDRPPRVCTKTDRGTQFIAATFAQALKGRCDPPLQHPAGESLYNGETERGQRDNRDIIYKYLHRMKRPRAGHELEAVRRACRQARIDLNEHISRPSLGNVTPEEVVRGEAEAVQERNRNYVARARAERKQRQASGKRAAWKDRIAALLNPANWDSSRLLRFVRLARRDYRAVTG